MRVLARCRFYLVYGINGVADGRLHKQVRRCPDASCRQASIVREYYPEERDLRLGEETGLLCDDTYEGPREPRADCEAAQVDGLRGSCCGDESDRVRAG